jgi:nucleoid-associated protein YgaU
MQRGGRIALAAGVLLTGTLGAMLFRHPHCAVPGPVERGDALLLRKQVGPSASAPVTVRPSVRIESQAADSTPLAQPPVTLLPMDPGQPPPELAKTYPGAGPISAGSWESPPVEEEQSEGRPAVRMRTHKITDGDTLGALAERYLGAASRSEEIFQANRDVLSAPGLLPIGVILKIPLPASDPASNTARASGRPLVPVPAKTLDSASN